MKFMNKLQDKLKKAKKDNKGFSLVELIIVIAIMAILVGIVGTQVIPYINKSRESKDIQKISGLCTDAMTAYSSNAATLGEGTYTITIAKGTGDKITVTTTGSGDTSILKDALYELDKYENVGSLNLESKKSKDISKIVITCQNGDPMVKVSSLKSGASASDPDTKVFDDITSK